MLGVIIKTIQTTLNIGKNDLERKMKQAQTFLLKREQVRIIILLKGRQKNNPNSALVFLSSIHNNYLKDFGSLTKKPSESNLSLTYNPISK